MRICTAALLPTTSWRGRSSKFGHWLHAWLWDSATSTATCNLFKLNWEELKKIHSQIMSQTKTVRTACVTASHTLNCTSTVTTTLKKMCGVPEREIKMADNISVIGTGKGSTAASFPKEPVSPPILTILERAGRYCLHGYIWRVDIARSSKSFSWSIFSLRFCNDDLIVTLSWRKKEKKSFLFLFCYHLTL